MGKGLYLYTPVHIPVHKHGHGYVMVRVRDIAYVMLRAGLLGWWLLKGNLILQIFKYCPWASKETAYVDAWWA